MKKLTIDVHGRKVHIFIDQEGNIYSEKGRLRKATVHKTGYVDVAFCSWGGKNSRKMKTFKAHRLVAEAYYRPLRVGEVVNHLNFIRHDNRVSNLEIVTPLENRRHAQEHERISSFYTYPVFKKALYLHYVCKKSSAEINRELKIDARIISCWLRGKHSFFKEKYLKEGNPFGIVLWKNHKFGLQKSGRLGPL